MKKFISVFLIAVASAAFCSSVYAADSTITVELDKEPVSFESQQPVIVEGRTLIPLRGVFEKMGYTISWDGNTKTALLISDKTRVSVTAGSSEFTVNGETKALDVPAQIMNGSMMLPLRAIGEAAGANVTWNGAVKTVEIDTKSANVSDIIKTSDYLVSYAKAVEPISEVEELCTELKGLDGEITAPELQSYRVRLYNAGQTITSVKESVERLEVPDSMAELHTVRLEALDKLLENINVLIDYCDGKISEKALTDKINTIAAEADAITKKNNELLESIETE